MKRSDRSFTFQRALRRASGKGKLKGTSHSVNLMHRSFGTRTLPDLSKDMSFFHKVNTGQSGGWPHRLRDLREGGDDGTSESLRGIKTANSGYGGQVALEGLAITHIWRRRRDRCSDTQIAHMRWYRIFPPVGRDRVRGNSARQKALTPALSQRERGIKGVASPRGRGRKSFADRLLARCSRTL